MSIVKYKVNKYGNYQIQEITITGETPKMVIFNNGLSKELKNCDSYQYADSMEDAKAIKIAAIDAQIRDNESKIFYLENDIEKLRKMKMQ